MHVMTEVGARHAITARNMTLKEFCNSIPWIIQLIKHHILIICWNYSPVHQYAMVDYKLCFRYMETVRFPRCHLHEYILTLYQKRQLLTSMVAFGGISCTPLLPYASSGGTTSKRCQKRISHSSAHEKKRYSVEIQRA